MDHPRGGKRLRFDQPLTGYPPARRQRLHPPTSSRPLPAIAPASSGPAQQPISTDLPPSQHVLLPPNQSPLSTTSVSRVLLPAVQPALSATTGRHRPVLPTPTRPTRPIPPTRPAVPAGAEAVIPTQLIENHNRRQAATDRFPPEISDACVRDCMARYEDHISSVIKSTEAICGSCGRFIEQQVFRLPELDPLLQPCYLSADSSLRLDSCAKIGSATCSAALAILPSHRTGRQNTPPSTESTSPSASPTLASCKN